MQILENAAWKVTLSDMGTIDSLSSRTSTGMEPYAVRSGPFAGPSWYGIWDGAQQVLSLTRAGTQRFEGRSGSLTAGLEYHLEDDRLVLRAWLRNDGSAPFCPQKAGLHLGLDTCMESYPAWDGKLFPTLLRCEADHFWGYLMSPLGRILAVASPDAVASWSLEYNHTFYTYNWVNVVNHDTPWSLHETLPGDVMRHEGHRIETANLDLLNALPLPARHPQHQDALAPGEEKSWTIYFLPVEHLADLKPALAEVCGAPMIELERHTLAAGEAAHVRIFGRSRPTLQAAAPDGSLSMLQPAATGTGWMDFVFTPAHGEGVYTLTAHANGKQSEASLYLRKPWSWYLRQARAEAVRMPQKATTHAETWLGCFSAFLARRHFPDVELDRLAEQNFREILSLMFDLQKAEPITDPARILNTAAMVGLLTDVYEAKGSLGDLDLAARLADWLIATQDANGAYRADFGHGGHYTAVTYIAKYMLELTQAEEPLGATNPLWRSRYERHYRSVQAAVDDLARLLDNIGTEGEHTFEDGMISCSVLQLAGFALLQKDPAERERYTRAALKVLEKHTCLEQLVVPDCRTHGATLRFWEAQYDVLIRCNMLNSPHGWTSWKTYATWYLYLLTGEEHFLSETMDTLGACMQMIDLPSGELRWAFVPDPSIHARVFEADPQRPGQGKLVERVLGEQYVPMISDWWLAPHDRPVGGYWDQGGCCDNDVHEHFKCLEETALTSAYVLERASGEWVAWNCRVEQGGGELVITPLEEVIGAVHANLQHPRRVRVQFVGGSTAAQVSGMQWIYRQE